MVRAPPCHGGGHGFEPHPGRLCYYSLSCDICNIIWGLSSAGRASALQAEGHRFEPYRPHLMRLSILGRRGGIGRRLGLKIQWEEIPVPVQVRSPALGFANTNQFNMYALIAQLDRAFGYGPKGWGFESLLAHCLRICMCTGPFFGLFIVFDMLAALPGNPDDCYVVYIDSIKIILV